MAVLGPHEPRVITSSVKIQKNALIALKGRATSLLQILIFNTQLDSSLILWHLDIKIARQPPN